jgi:DNA polymerase/3'-5' exonuclease PolX
VVARRSAETPAERYALNRHDWRTWLPNDDDDDDEDDVRLCSTELSSTRKRRSSVLEDPDRTRDDNDDDDDRIEEFHFVPPSSLTAPVFEHDDEADTAAAAEDDADDGDEDDVVNAAKETVLIPALPRSLLVQGRANVTPAVSQVDDSDTVPLERSATVPSPVPVPVTHDDDATEELPQLPVLSPERSGGGGGSKKRVFAATRAGAEASDDPLAVARDVDSASLSPTIEYFRAKREREGASSTAFVDTSQWRPQWRPTLRQVNDDDLKEPPRVDSANDGETVNDASDGETVREGRTADAAPSRLSEREQVAWRRYQASVSALEKTARAAPLCHCRLAAVVRDVKKATANYGRSFWGCAKPKTRCKFFEWADDGRPWDEMSERGRIEAHNNKVRATLACQTVLRPEQKQSNLNRHITAPLEKLREQYKATGDAMHELGYTKAINAFKRCRYVISSGAEALKLYGVGARIAAKVDEICRTGALRQADYATDCDVGRTTALFSKVWGAGPATVREWVAAGWRTLDDLRANVDKLNRHQQIGLARYHDFLERIPRDEVGRIESLIARICVKYDSAFVVVACGSYRRGKADCGDVDILVTHPDGTSHASILRPLLRRLSRDGYLTDTLTISEASKERQERKMASGSGEVHGTQSSYHGVFRLLEPGSLHRRLDIICVPYNEMGCALLYFTGSDYFNRSMRHFAKQMGYSLSQHGIAPAVRTNRGKTKNHVGTPVPTPTELDVFNLLGLDFVEPDNRDPGKEPNKT